MFGSRWPAKPPVGTQIDWSHPFAEGLVALWVFDEGTGAPVDVVSHTSATGNNMTWGAAPGGRVLTGDGSSKYVNLGSSTSWLNIAGQLTLICYGNPAGSGSQQNLIDIHNHSATAGYALLAAFTGNNDLSLYLGTSSTSNTLTSNSNMVDGTYHVFGASWNGTTNANGVSFYRDGGPQGTATSANLLSAWSGQAALGARNDGGARWLSGSLGWVAIWNVALPAAIHAVIGSSANAIYQLFRPQRSIMWSFAAARGASNYWGRSVNRPQSRPISGPAIPLLYG